MRFLIAQKYKQKSTLANIFSRETRFLILLYKM